MSIQEDQRKRLGRITAQATEIRGKLSHLSQTGTVHFRPTDDRITMVGLLPHRPQRGKGGYRADYLLDHFETEFNKYCNEIAQGRPTPEKELQSFLITQAYQHGGKLETLRPIADDSIQPTELYFVTDELAMFTPTGKVVCDILALRRGPHDPTKDIPVLIELKSARQMTELVKQLERYKVVMMEYSHHFEKLFGAILGEEIRFSDSIEKWLIWPASNSVRDPKEPKLAQLGIRVVQYTKNEYGFDFQIGQTPVATPTPSTSSPGNLFRFPP